MKKVLLIILLVLLGMGIFFYPSVANYFSSKNASKEITEFTKSVEQIDKKTIADEIKSAQNYNKQLTGEGIRDPFVPGSGIVMSEDYLNLLNINNGMMGYITIPKINVNLPIYHGSSDATLQKGVGHLEGTALPVGGQSTHAALTGHSALTNAKMFTDLTEIKEGDTFYLYIFNEVLAYRVDQIKVVLPSNTEDLMPVKNKDYVTLITCTPYGVNSHRLLVRGGRIPYTPGAETAAGNEEKTGGWSEETRNIFIAAAITAAVMLIFIFIAILLRRKKNKREDRPTVIAAGTRIETPDEENTELSTDVNEIPEILDIETILKMLEEEIWRKK